MLLKKFLDLWIVIRKHCVMKKPFHELTLFYSFLTGKCVLPPKYPGWAQGPHWRRLMPSLSGNIHGKPPGLEVSPSKYSSSAEKIKQVSDFEFTVWNVVDSCSQKYNLVEQVPFQSDILSFSMCNYRIFSYLVFALFYLFLFRYLI